MAPRLRDWTDDAGDARTRNRLPTPARLYSEAVRVLARRELTTQQLRDRLAAAGGRASDIDGVLSRLKEEGAIDDRRAALIYAKRAFNQRKRARGRIEQELRQLGIRAEVVRDVVNDVCGEDLERRRLDKTVIFALRGTRRDHRDQDVRRLFASLVRQGYEPDDVKASLARAGIDESTLE